MNVISFKFKSIITVISTVALIGIIVATYFFFKENAWPTDYKIEPIEWAKSFKWFMVIAAVVCIVINVIIWLIVGINKYNCPQNLWWWLGIMVIISALIEVCVFEFLHPEKSICIWICGCVTVLMNIVIYWRCTAHYPSEWCFYPFD